MATAKQIAANRANAARSTGPRTTAGREKSSRNALRHGLSLPLAVDLAARTEIVALAQSVVGENPTEQQLMVAIEFALAEFELRRIRKMRAAAIPISVTSGSYLRGLVGFDRYEQAALARRRRAVRKVDRIDNDLSNSAHGPSSKHQLPQVF